MTRKEIFRAIDNEREYHIYRWGKKFGKKNTANDWIAMIGGYATQTARGPFKKEVFVNSMIAVAGLAVAALEQGEGAKHYDKRRKT